MLSSASSSTLTKPAYDVGVGLSLQLDDGLFWLVFLMVTQAIAKDSLYLRGGLPARHNGSAVQRLKLENRG